VDTQSNQIRCFGRTCTYMVNMFIATKECAPSKDAKNYHPSQRFGMHRREGDFMNSWTIFLNNFRMT